MRPRRPVRPPGMGVKNIERIKIINRGFKIKGAMEQPRNVEVKRNGKVVRRMVVRRCTIYPGEFRRLLWNKGIDCLFFKIYTTRF